MWQGKMPNANSFSACRKEIYIEGFFFLLLCLWKQISFTMLYIFIYSGLCWVFVTVRAFLSLWGARATLLVACGLLTAVASLGTGNRQRRLQCCCCTSSGAAVPRAQAQELWHTGLVAPWHVASFRPKDRTRVSCTDHWESPDSVPLSHQGSPTILDVITDLRCKLRLPFQAAQSRHIRLV